MRTGVILRGRSRVSSIPHESDLRGLCEWGEFGVLGEADREPTGGLIG